MADQTEQSRGSGSTKLDCGGGAASAMRQSIKLSLLLIYGLMLAIRVPELLWPGRLWAEEGTVYFLSCVKKPLWRFMTSVDLGYYSLFNKVAMLPAAKLAPLEYAPVVTGWIAFFAMMTPAWLWLWSRDSHGEKPGPLVVGLMAMLFMQPNTEVWMTTISAQFYFCVATAVILVSSAGSRRMHAARLAVLAMAGLTGVLSCMLMPFFAIEYLLSGRDRRKRDEAVCIGVATLVQFLCVIHAGGRAGSADPGILPWALLVKQWALPLFGAERADEFAGVIISRALWESVPLTLTALAPYAVAGAGLLIVGGRKPMLLFSGSFTVVSLSFLKSVGFDNPDVLLEHVSAFGAERYYYAPNILLGLAFVLAFVASGGRGRIRRGLGVFFMAVAMIGIANGAYAYFNRDNYMANYMFEGPFWRDEIEAWRSGEKPYINIWPRPWLLPMPKEDVRH